VTRVPLFPFVWADVGLVRQTDIALRCVATRDPLKTVKKHHHRRTTSNKTLCTTCQRSDRLCVCGGLRTYIHIFYGRLLISAGQPRLLPGSPQHGRHALTLKTNEHFLTHVRRITRRIGSPRTPASCQITTLCTYFWNSKHLKR